MAKQSAEPAAPPHPAAGDRVELSSGEQGIVVAAGQAELAVYPGDDGEATSEVQLWATRHVRVRARALYLDDEDEALLRDLLRREVNALPEVARNWTPGITTQQERIDRLRGLLTRGARAGEPEPTSSP